MNVSVVIPCYRSRATLPELVARLHVSLAEVVDDYEILLIVDGSPDDTYAVARSLEIEDGRVTAPVLDLQAPCDRVRIVRGTVHDEQDLVVVDDLRQRDMQPRDEFRQRSARAITRNDD